MSTSDEPRKGLPPDPAGGLESFSINEPNPARGPAKGLPPDESGGAGNFTHHRPQHVSDTTARTSSSSTNDVEIATGDQSAPASIKAIGDWFHSHQEKRVVAAIKSGGWRPDLNTGSKFGCGVYLARGQWHEDAKWLIRCRLNLADTEVLDLFPAVEGFDSHKEGNTERHLERYLVSQGVVSGRPKAERGNSHQNRSISEFFLKQGIKAVKFVEHDKEVIVIYDLSAIEIVDVRPV